MTTKLTFEDRLLDQLRGLVAASPAPTAPFNRRATRRYVFGAAAGVAVASAAAVTAIALSGGASNAYALDTEPSGVVIVHITSLQDATGLQNSLQNAGIPAVVDYTPNCTPSPPPDGTDGGSTGQATGRPAWDILDVQVTRDAKGVTFRIDPAQINPGQKVFITTATRGQLDALSIAIGSEAPTPVCPPQP